MLRVCLRPDDRLLLRVTHSDEQFTSVALLGCLATAALALESADVGVDTEFVLATTVEGLRTETGLATAADLDSTVSRRLIACCCSAACSTSPSLFLVYLTFWCILTAGLLLAPVSN